MSMAPSVVIASLIDKRIQRNYPIAETAFAPAKFSTECWFLTLQAHHLSVLPCIRRYQRRLRALRDVDGMIQQYRDFGVLTENCLNNETNSKPVEIPKFGSFYRLWTYLHGWLLLLPSGGLKESNL